MKKMTCGDREYFCRNKGKNVDMIFMRMISIADINPY